MNYKLCILTTGVGSRMGEFTKYFNKALIPIQGKPVINHILEKIPKNIETVIALGHLKESLRNYIETAYPERKFTFVEIDKYIGPGTGPGYSLLQCRDSLKSPFILSSVDTLVKEEMPEPSQNWFGVSEVPDVERFCSVKVEKEKIVRIDDKIKNNNQLAFIGLAGIKDYNVFFNALQENQNSIRGEIQVSNGFEALVDNGLIPKKFTWFDTGTIQSYKHAMKNYPDGSSYKGE